MKFLKTFESLDEITFSEHDFDEIKDIFQDIIDEWNLIRVDINSEVFTFPKDSISYDIINNGFIVIVQIAIPNEYEIINKKEFEQDCDDFIKRIRRMNISTSGFTKSKSLFMEIWTTAMHKKV